MPATFNGPRLITSHFVRPSFSKLMRNASRLNGGFRFAIGAIAMVTAGYSIQACSQNDHLELRSIEELMVLQETAQAEFGKTGEVKKWGDASVDSMDIRVDRILFEDDFQNLSNWHHEGIGFLSQPDSNLMQLNCVGSGQGGAGCMAFGKGDFPDSICIEYDLRVLTTNGLLITFIACEGRSGEDMLNELPKREGVFADYVYNPALRSYHVSVSRYNDDGNHTGVSNWRRNPGLFLMAEQPDLCKEPRKWYHIKILKRGGYLQMHVDGEFAGGFVDLDEIPEPLPKSGKIGFRAIGSKVLVQIKNFKVSSIKGGAVVGLN